MTVGEIIVSSSDLSSALSWVSRSIPARPAITALAGVLLTEEDGTLTLFGHDGGEAASITIPCEGGGTFGKHLLPGKLLMDIAQMLPNGPVTITPEKTFATITAGRSTFKVPLFSLKEYPAEPIMSEVQDKVPGKLLSDAIHRVAVAAGKDDALPVLTSVLVSAVPAEGRIDFVATDRFRLAHRALPYVPQGNDEEPWSAMVYAKDLVGYAKALSSEDFITFGLTPEKGRIVMSAGSRTAIVPLLDGEYPRWDNLLNSLKITNVAEADAAELLSAVKRVSIAAEGPTPIILVFDPVGELTITVDSGDNVASEAVPCAWDGEEPFRIGFNPAVLADALSVCGNKTVKFNVSLPTKPALLTVDEELGTYVHLLMPIRN